MSKTFKLAAVAAVCAAAAAAHAQVAWDANIEFDNTYTASRDKPSTEGSTEIGGRVELNANATIAKSGDNFVNGRATLIVPVNGNEVHMDDAWLQFGNSTADFKLGRFEAADLFPMGMDTVVIPATDAIGAVAGGYRANVLRGRVTDGRFHGALGLNAAPGLRLELGMVAEKAGNTNPSGLRPVAVYSTGPLTVRAGLEAIQSNDPAVKSSTGVGLSAGYELNKTTMINASYAHNNELDATSFGANVVMGMFGLGAVQDKTADKKANTVYAAYKFPLLGVKNAFVTPAISVSNGTDVDNLVAFRVRLNYAF